MENQVFEEQKIMHALLITFDTEDWISKNSVPVLQKVLESLHKHNLKGLFFITGQMAEALQNYPEVADMLRVHQIGYHSSGHSTHPAIFEFSDVESYDEAKKISYERETSHIDPLTGNINGEGGILTLRKLFPSNEILAFRAPGHCWGPPHLEALSTLGIKYDFSTSISRDAVAFKGFTFYPYPITGHWTGTLSEYSILLNCLLRYKNVVMTIHPSLIGNKVEWDAQYHNSSNPQTLEEPPSRSPQETSLLLDKLDKLFRRVSSLQKISLLSEKADLKMAEKEFHPSESEINRCYQASIKWTSKFNYQPKYLHDHFLTFFSS
jgi:hypothetical protein